MPNLRAESVFLQAAESCDSMMGLEKWNEISQLIFLKAENTQLMPYKKIKGNNVREHADFSCYIANLWCSKCAKLHVVSIFS